MNRPISGSSDGPPWRRWRDDRQGSAIVNFALILPLLMAFSFATLEFTLLMFDFHRASEATRRGARMAMVGDPIASLDTIADGGEIVCGSSGGSLDCSGGAVVSSGTFDALVDGMRNVFPAIDAGDVEVAYSYSGIGDIATPGGIKPLITVSLTGVRHDFVLLRAVPGGFTSIGLPSFSTSQLGQGYSTSP